MHQLEVELLRKAAQVAQHAKGPLASTRFDYDKYPCEAVVDPAELVEVYATTMPHSPLRRVALKLACVQPHEFGTWPERFAGVDLTDLLADVAQELQVKMLAGRTEARPLYRDLLEACRPAASLGRRSRGSIH